MDRPLSTAEVAELLRRAAAERSRVAAHGNATKLDWGGAGEGVDLTVDLTGLAGVVEYAPNDLVVRVAAGTPLADLQEVCAGERQMLALDPIVAGGTVGGTLATNTSGPYRMRYGTSRDLLIGITVVLADGTVARSGGKVVKNVAGYDLGKLYIGSYGTLGLITEAVFRLHPLPPARAVAMRDFAESGAAVAAAERVRRSQLAVSALEVNRPEPGGSWTVATLIEGPLGSRPEQAAALLGPDATVSEGPPEWWGQAPWPADGTAIKVTTRLSLVDAVLGRLPGAVRGSLGAGVLYAGLPAEADPIGPVEALRGGFALGDGSAVVLRSPVTDGLDRWGPVGGLALMRRVKQQFDPYRLLAPGRFVGGI